MEVILKQDIANLGDTDDIVSVKNGYGRNYLIPKGFAILATEANKKAHEHMLSQRAFKDKKLRDEAENQAKALADITVKVGAKAGESGKIFGSVTAVQLADAMKKAGHDVERKNITISGSVKELGTYAAKIKLYRDIYAEVNFEVVAE